MLKEAERDNRKFIATYEGFENVEGKTIPSVLDFKIETAEKKVRIKIEFTKMQLDQELTFPFRIPEGYKELKDLQSAK